MSQAPAQKLPIGIQDFAKLHEEGFLYVDKTRYLHQLIQDGSVYFMSRPRRFGKSLMISALECIFKGRKELFQDTWIADSDCGWQEHPVIRIDMSRADRSGPERFSNSLIDLLAQIAKHYDVKLNSKSNAGIALDSLISNLAEKHGRVVILVDEYDKPILDNIGNIELAKTMRNCLRDFYTILEAQDGNIRFVMLTGVTKFSKVSVFSGLNNLQDLTMTDKYAAMLGYTQSELEENFAPWIKQLDAKFDAPQLDTIQRWYNGYRFSEEGEHVYNPFSTMLLFEHMKYKPYWFSTGTPTFLLELVTKHNYHVQEIEHFKTDTLGLESHDIDDMGLIALLYQTGYLTIKSHNTDRDLLTLGYPNLEVQSSFQKSLLTYITQSPGAPQTSTLITLSDALLAADYDTAIQTLQSFLAGIPYELHQRGEKYYQTIFYLIFKVLGYRMGVEVSTHTGRIDAIIKLQDRVLIFEFKLDQSAETALAQIHDKGYYQPFQNSGKAIILFGVNFDTHDKNISDWTLQELGKS